MMWGRFSKVGPILVIVLVLGLLQACQPVGRAGRIPKEAQLDEHEGVQAAAAAQLSEAADSIRRMSDSSWGVADAVLGEPIALYDFSEECVTRSDAWACVEPEPSRFHVPVLVDEKVVGSFELGKSGTEFALLEIVQGPGPTLDIERAMRELTSDVGGKAELRVVPGGCSVVLARNGDGVAGLFFDNRTGGVPSGPEDDSVQFQVVEYRVYSGAELVDLLKMLYP